VRAAAIFVYIWRHFKSRDFVYIRDFCLHLTSLPVTWLGHVTTSCNLIGRGAGPAQVALLLLMLNVSYYHHYSKLFTVFWNEKGSYCLFQALAVISKSLLRWTKISLVLLFKFVIIHCNFSDYISCQRRSENEECLFYVYSCGLKTSCRLIKNDEVVFCGMLAFRSMQLLLEITA
jgi:hypothetical protein